MEQNTVATNQQKHENYAEQFRRLNKALNGGFHLEAMFIEYAIMEDRTESILRHAGLWEAYLSGLRSKYPTIDSKISFIRKRAENKRSPLHKYFSDDLLDQLKVWKNQRNRLIHALLKQQLAHNEIRDLAYQGQELAKALRTRATTFNRIMDRNA